MITPHLQYWEKCIQEYKIKAPITDACNTRVWEKTYNVNLDSLKGGNTPYTPYRYTDGSKKAEGTGGGFVV